MCPSRSKRLTASAFLSLLVAPGDGAILAPPCFPSYSPSLFSRRIIAERSSPSRVRFAAPNIGAPLTAPGRSQENLPGRRERLISKAADNVGARGAKMALFLLPRYCHRNSCAELHVILAFEQVKSVTKISAGRIQTGYRR